MRNLRLPLKKRWFEITKAGIKTEDYREITPYWASRLFTDFGIQRTQKDWENRIEDIKNNVFIRPIIFAQNTMTLGLPKAGESEKIITFKHKGIEIRTGNTEWGAEPNKIYFVILHGERC